jgi:L-lactate utilization protein LutB
MPRVKKSAQLQKIIEEPIEEPVEEDYESDDSLPLEKVPKKITGNNKPRTEAQIEQFKKCIAKRMEIAKIKKEKKLEEVAQLQEIRNLLQEKKNLKSLNDTKDNLSDVHKTLTRTKPKRNITFYSSSEDEEEEKPVAKVVKRKQPVNITINNEMPKATNEALKPKFRTPMFI